MLQIFQIPYNLRYFYLGLVTIKNFFKQFTFQKLMIN